MTHLFGVPIQNQKQLWSALMQIPGVGRNKSLSICRQLGFSPRVLWQNLTLKQKNALKASILKSYQGNGATKNNSLGTQYWQELKKQKAFLIKLGTRRGIRLRQGLPVRGQRTHSNARTVRRGPSSLG